MASDALINLNDTDYVVVSRLALPKSRVVRPITIPVPKQDRSNRGSNTDLKRPSNSNDNSLSKLQTYSKSISPDKTVSVQPAPQGLFKKVATATPPKENKPHSKTSIALFSTHREPATTTVVRQWYPPKTCTNKRHS